MLFYNFSKKSVFFVLTIFILSCDSQVPSASREESKTLELKETKSIKISNIEGNITVSKSQSDGIVVRSIKKSSVESDLSKVDVVITEGENLLVSADYKTTSSNTSVDFFVSIPADIIVSVKNTKGDITISDIKNVDTIKSNSASVVVSNSETIKEIVIDTGTVTAKITKMLSDVLVKVTTGNIKLIVTTDDYKKIDAKTTAGNIYRILSEYGLGIYNIAAETISGSITISYQ
ncbi:MAG TPA: hypothetical protein PLO89_09960 [Spirochaetota bacterium]|nr:hypothetical protein [Spirochaetota bacterium]